VKIFLICSKAFYGDIPPIKKQLEQSGHEIILPNSYDNPDSEREAYDSGNHLKFKKKMFQRSQDATKYVDAVLCLNFEKHGVKNYVGGATFLELYDAFMLDKKIFLWNDIPKGILYDEIHGFAPTVINGRVERIK
jgi:hypothetical protein